MALLHVGQNGGPSIGYDDDKHQSDDDVNRGCLSNIESVTREDTSFLSHKKPCKVIDTADLIDKMSRALFPLIFLIFNIVYWCYYSLAN